MAATPAKAAPFIYSVPTSADTPSVDVFSKAGSYMRSLRLAGEVLAVHELPTDRGARHAFSHDGSLGLVTIVNFDGDEVSGYTRRAFAVEALEDRR